MSSRPQRTDTSTPMVVEAKAVIDSPVPAVFAFVADLRNEPKWNADMVEIRPAPSSPTETGLGSSWVGTVSFMGRNEYEMEVTGFEPNRRVEITTRTGPLRPTITYSLEPTTGGTLFTMRVETPIRGIYRLMKPLMERMAPKRNQRQLGNLKSILERHDD